MKKLLLLLWLTPAIMRAQTLSLVDETFMQKALSAKIDVVSAIVDLKNKPIPTGDIVVLVQGKVLPTDGQGAFYKWMPSSVDAEDLTFLNVILSSLTQNGRWIRLNVKNMQLPHGVLNMNAGFKTFYSAGTINASSEATVNLTYDGTATGIPIFSKVLYRQSNAIVNATAANEAVGNCPKPMTDLKVLTFRYFKVAAPVTMTLGLLITPAANAPVGTSVEFEIKGQ